MGIYNKVVRSHINNPLEAFQAKTARDDEERRDNSENNLPRSFRAVVLSSPFEENNIGSATNSSMPGPNGKITIIDGKTFLTVSIKPISDTEYRNISGEMVLTAVDSPVSGDSAPDLKDIKDKEEFKNLLKLYHINDNFQATSEEPMGDTSLQFGQIINCYYRSGDPNKGTGNDLVFKKPLSILLHPSYISLANIAELDSSKEPFRQSSVFLLDSFEADPALAEESPPMEDLQGSSSGGKTSPSQALFIADLEAALKEKGLPFLVTDRTRTVDEQMQRIMNKYKKNGPQEVVATYARKGRGAKMVAAIRAGDQATFRQLASESSNHLTGNAIDIRSKHYTNEQMTVVLQEIRKLGGTPVVENIKGCWTKSGRNVTSTQRVAGAKAGGRGPKTPCHNEHIHIDVPEDYSAR